MLDLQPAAGICNAEQVHAPLQLLWSSVSPKVKALKSSVNMQPA